MREQSAESGGEKVGGEGHGYSSQHTFQTGMNPEPEGDWNLVRKEMKQTLPLQITSPLHHKTMHNIHKYTKTSSNHSL